MDATPSRSGSVDRKFFTVTQDPHTKVETITLDPTIRQTDVVKVLDGDGHFKDLVWSSAPESAREKALWC